MATIRSFDGTQEIEGEVLRPDRFRQLFSDLGRPDVIARGAGLNYCIAGGVANGRTVLSTAFNRFIAFDRERSTVRAEAGVTMGQLFEFAIARGLLPPILPGHPWISVGGALAMNIHGKNQHRFGNFGDHVLRLSLYHPQHKEIVCSPTENAEVFWLTVGGFGLSGFLLSVDIALKPLPGKSMIVERHEVGNLAEAAALMETLSETADYLYSWHDLNVKGSNFGRGIVYAERFSSIPRRTYVSRTSTAAFKPFPWTMLNSVTLPLMCRLYRYKEAFSGQQETEDLYSGSFPIVGKETYFRLFGPQGFREYQLLVPSGAWPDFAERLASAIQISRLPIALASLKLFRGERRFLNFTGNGISLALDVPNTESSADFFTKLDEITVNAGGIAYIAKDSRLSAETIRAMYSGYHSFRAALREYDPARHFQSELSRRLDL